MTLICNDLRVCPHEELRTAECDHVNTSMSSQHESRLQRSHTDPRKFTCSWKVMHYFPGIAVCLLSVSACACVWRANEDEWRLVFTRSRDNKWLIWIQDFCFHLWTIRKLLDRLLLGLQSVCNPSKIPESLQNNPTLYEVLNQSNISQNQQQWPASQKPARKLSETIVTQHRVQLQANTS